MANKYGMQERKKSLQLLCLAAIAVVLISFHTTAQDTTSVIIQSKTGKLIVERLAKLSEPWGMGFLPDGRLLVTEKPGRLRIFADGKLSEPVGGLPKIDYYQQGGLLDVEIDPGFSGNQLVYIYYVEAAEIQPKGARDPGDKRFGEYNDTTDVMLKGGAVARGRLDGNSLRDVKVIWRQYPKTIGRGHFGGRLVFAADGKLFITSGDRMRFEPAQDPSNNLGKIVRINPDGSIPKDNPFINRRGARPDIWSMGHRNPLGSAINPSTKKFWMHEMGPWNGDEINISDPAKNYGWPTVSNGNNYDGSKIPDHPARPQFSPPAYYWHPAISPSGMTFYTANLLPEWNGNLLLGGLSSESLFRLTLEGNVIKSEERIFLQKRIRDVVQAPDGSVWLLTDYKDGELLRVRPGGK